MFSTLKEQYAKWHLRPGRGRDISLSVWHSRAGSCTGTPFPWIGPNSICRGSLDFGSFLATVENAGSVTGIGQVGSAQLHCDLGQKLVMMLCLWACQGLMS